MRFFIPDKSNGPSVCPDEGGDGVKKSCKGRTTIPFSSLHLTVLLLYWKSGRVVSETNSTPTTTTTTTTDIATDTGTKTLLIVSESIDRIVLNTERDVH